METLSTWEIRAIAAACHLVNRAYCLARGDDTQPLWSDAPDWQRQSALLGVGGALAGNTPEQSHQSWYDEKLKDGWRWGWNKDAEAKTHPCMVPYSHLPDWQKVKDRLFIDTARQIAAVLREPV